MKKLVVMSVNQYSKQGCIKCGSDFDSVDKIEAVQTFDKNGNKVETYNQYKVVNCIECGKEFVVSKEEIDKEQKVIITFADKEMELEKYEEAKNNKFRPSNR